MTDAVAPDTAGLEMREARAQQPLPDEPFHQWIAPDATIWADFHREAADYLVRFPGVADYSVSRDGLHIRCWPATGTDDATVRHLYLNQVVPLSLSRRGYLVMHASAIEAGGGAIAFMGESGQGKSTLAASFARTGFPFLTDDGLVLDKGPDGWRVQPGHPSIRLWPDSEAALSLGAAPRAEAVPFTSKSRFLASASIAPCDRAMPLRRIYLLGRDRGQQPTFKRLRPAIALVELVKHSFLLDMQDQEALTAHFESLCNLIQLCDCYRVDYSRSYENLAAVRNGILAHADTAIDAPAERRLYRTDP